MEEIKLNKPTDKELSDMGVTRWPIWEKEVSTFDWSYDSTEMCYLLAGKVAVKTADGKIVEFGKGDFVTFPEGLSCTWEVKEPVRKHYKFK
ncbi:MAG: cupin domain-containing protein [Nitrospirae bacterium]|nr:cupin domain-containing protein [Nitrospirota bacterium]